MARALVVYAVFSTFAYLVNLLLASRFLKVGATTSLVMSLMALGLYAGCLAINWVWQVRAAGRPRRLHPTGSAEPILIGPAPRHTAPPRTAPPHPRRHRPIPPHTTQVRFLTSLWWRDPSIGIYIYCAFMSMVVYDDVVLVTARRQLNPGRVCTPVVWTHTP